MNELISNDLTGARMTTIDIMNLLNANLPANKKHPYDHFEIIKKVEDLMRMNIIHLQKKIEVDNNQTLSNHSKVRGYEFIGKQGERDSIVVIAQFQPKVTGVLYDKWDALREENRQLKEHLLMLTKQEDLKKDAERLLNELDHGDVDVNAVTELLNRYNHSSHHAGQQLSLVRKTKPIVKQLHHNTIELLQPELPLETAEQ
ncbi:hypothetical protein J5T16_001737 [Escherichia coli]|nr:hypothetical protein [Escherichia coli]HCP7592351.1 hypothetical protein [Escherichia coli]